MAGSDQTKKSFKLRSQRWFDDPEDPGMTALYTERYLNFGMTRGELHVVPVARHEVAARLRDADDRLARLQLFERQAEVHVALEIERRHVGIRGIIEPGARTQAS